MRKNKRKKKERKKEKETEEDADREKQCKQRLKELQSLNFEILHYFDSNESISIQAEVNMINTSYQAIDI